MHAPVHVRHMSEEREPISSTRGVELYKKAVVLAFECLNIDQALQTCQTCILPTYFFSNCRCVCCLITFDQAENSTSVFLYHQSQTVTITSSGICVAPEMAADILMLTRAHILSLTTSNFGCTLMQAGISLAPHVRLAVVAGVLGAALLGWLVRQHAKTRAASQAVANTAALNERSLAAQKQVSLRFLGADHLAVLQQS